MPNVHDGQYLDLKKINSLQHFTEPPARYSEASLVKKMEELGIGRPSTYASILSVIQEREYVKLEKKKFFPEEKGRIVTAFLKKFFSKYVEYNYTAKLEDDLDKIANGKEDWKEFLKEFWEPFHTDTEQVLTIPNTDIINGLMENLKNHILGIDENGNLKDKCPDCQTGKLNLKLGKFGAFVACSNYPECKYAKNIASLTVSNDNEESTTESFENKILGQLDSKNVYLKKGPYGFYVQQGEDSTDKKIKPKRASIPKTTQNPQEYTFEQAKSLLALPRLVGNHPVDKGEIKANIGPFGPYLMYNGKFYSVKKEYDIMTVELPTAVIIIEEGNKAKKLKEEKMKTEGKAPIVKTAETTKKTATKKVATKKVATKTTTKIAKRSTSKESE